jgi:hypothetical protein
MLKHHRRRIRTALLLGLIGLLAVAPFGLPGTAVARPYLINDGPGPTFGDPTADDQPSPAPKKAPKMPVATPGIRSNHTASGAHRAVIAWRLFLRLLASIALR